MFSRRRNRRNRPILPPPGEAAEAAPAPEPGDIGQELARVELDEPPAYTFLPEYVSPEVEPGAYPDLPDDLRRDYGDRDDKLFVVSQYRLSDMSRLRGRMVPNTLAYHHGHARFHFLPHAQFGRGTTIAHTQNGLQAALDNERIRQAGQPDEAARSRPIYVYQLKPELVRRTPKKRLADLTQHSGFVPRMEVFDAQADPLRPEAADYYTPLTFEEAKIGDLREQTEILQLLSYADPDYAEEFQKGGYWANPPNEKAVADLAKSYTGFSNVFDEVHLHTPTGVDLEDLIPVEALEWKDNETPDLPSDTLYKALNKYDDKASRYQAMYGTDGEPRGGSLENYEPLVEAQILNDNQEDYDRYERRPPPRYQAGIPQLPIFRSLSNPPEYQESEAEAAAAPAPPDS
jgi:hypothetical protein